MLNKDIFVDGMEKLAAVFQNWQVKIDDPKTMKTWYSFFEHNTEREFNIMVDEYIQEERAYPTVAGLLEHGTPKSKYIDRSNYIDD